MYIITLIIGMAAYMYLCVNFLELEMAKYSIIVDLNEMVALLSNSIISVETQQ